MKLKPIAVAMFLALFVTVLPAQDTGRVTPIGIPVRFPEGSVHGFLALHTATGSKLADGDLLQTATRNGIESKMTFHFGNGSVFEETVTFTQNHVFAMQQYHLVQRGAAFENDLDATLSASGHFVVKTVDHKEGKAKTHEGDLELPADISNGMVIMLLKNLVRHDSQTVHMVAFTPQPRLIRLELTQVRETKVLNGDRTERVVEFNLKPKIGGLTGVLAKLLGKVPPDSRVSIVAQDVPAFVRFEGPLYTGPIWRIDLAAPRWPK